MSTPSSTESSVHFEPMVAMVCPKKADKGVIKYQNKFLTHRGKTQTKMCIKSAPYLHQKKGQLGIE